MLVATNERSRLYQVMVRNLSKEPALITHVAISEGSWASFPKDGSVQVTCSGAVYRVRDHILLKRNGYFAGTVGTRATDSLELEVPTQGYIDLACGSRGFSLEFDAQLAVDAVGQISFLVAVPRSLKVVRDTSALVTNPLAYVPPAAFRVDSLLAADAAHRQTLAVKLSTSDGRQLNYRAPAG